MINSMPLVKHEDDRRTLIEWVKDFPLRSCKALVIKKDCEVGNHHHNKKDELFYLLMGEGTVTLDSKTETITPNDTVYVGKGTRHAFNLKAGSILLEASSRAFDPLDEIK